MDLKKLLKWVPAIIICSISVYLSSQPTIEKMPSFPYADKLVHLVCFGGLAFWVAFACNLKGLSIREIILPTLIVSVYGIIDEIHQSFTPGRSCTVSDWLADTLGAFLGSLIFFLIIKLIVNRSKGIQ